MIKLAALTLFAGLSMSVATMVSGGVFLATGGVAVCRVATEEVDLTIPIPTHLIDAALITARLAMPDQELDSVRQEIEPWSPMIDAAARELADLPDGTVLVSVETAEETVRVERRGGRLRVDVSADDADVHVSLPARSVERIARQVTTFL
jgi:hypothetical protein